MQKIEKSGLPARRDRVSRWILRLRGGYVATFTELATLVSHPDEHGLCERSRNPESDHLSWVWMS